MSDQLRRLRAWDPVRTRRDGRLAADALDDDHVFSIYRVAPGHGGHTAPDAPQGGRS